MVRRIYRLLSLKHSFGRVVGERKVRPPMESLLRLLSAPPLRIVTLRYNVVPLVRVLVQRVSCLVGLPLVTRTTRPLNVVGALSI